MSVKRNLERCHFVFVGVLISCHMGKQCDPVMGIELFSSTGSGQDSRSSVERRGNDAITVKETTPGAFLALIPISLSHHPPLCRPHIEPSLCTIHPKDDLSFRSTASSHVLLSVPLFSLIYCYFLSARQYHSLSCPQLAKSRKHCKAHKILDWKSLLIFSFNYTRMHIIYEILPNILWLGLMWFIKYKQLF